MASGPPYKVRYAPIADAQIDAALLWWVHNRDKAPDRLARELDAALEQIALVPTAGRRARLRDQTGVRRLLLSVCAYHLYYVIDDDAHEVRIVYFRHARRRPLKSK
jgi:plasmid stabilization system protein ParE